MRPNTKSARGARAWCTALLLAAALPPAARAGVPRVPGERSAPGADSAWTAPAPAPDSVAAGGAPAPDSGAARAGTAPTADGAAAPAAVAPRAADPSGAAPGILHKVRLVHASRNVLRAGPGEDYAIVGVYPRDATFPVLAKSGDWYGVRLSDTQTGWVHRSLVREFDDLSDLQFRPNPRLYSRIGSFVLTGEGGGYAFDRESNSFMAGGGVGYYVLDRLVVGGGLSWTHVHRPAEIVESLFGLSLESEDFSMLFYHFDASWELLPGRQMVPFLAAGVGSTVMRGETDPSVDFGAGAAMYLSKRTALRWEVRDYRFTSGATSARRTNDNIAFTMGSSILF